MIARYPLSQTESFLISLQVFGVVKHLVRIAYTKTLQTWWPTFTPHLVLFNAMLKQSYMPEKMKVGVQRF